MMTRWIFILLVLPIMANALPSKVEFIMGNLSSAKEMAASEGKLYFAEFSASWCAPCRILEETTFEDPQVVDYISKNYIPVKIDIDDFDGLALKQVYNVQTLPTVIIFNSKGKLLEKYDQSLPPSKMLALLQKHNIPANRIKTAAAITSTSRPPIVNNTTRINHTPPSSRPVVKESHSPMKPSSVPSRPDKQPITPIRVNEPVTPAVTSAKPMPQGDGLYRFKVNTQASKGFSVQIGAFKEYRNVLREVARVQDVFNQPIIVHIVDQEDRSVYKILVGEFSNRKQAIDYQSSMKQKGVEGVIKDLSTMK